ncbi:MAG: DUF4111 domain-containing protein [bacterium]|nr:DUF4111 domain-containing protein [bacterium]
MEIADIKKLTPYQDVNDVLVTLTQGVHDILGDELVGLYLTGSLTYGDFNPESSDIDFLAIMSHTLSREKLEQIENMHTYIGENHTKWAKRIEGSYITKDMIEKAQPPQKPTTPRTYVNEGKVRPAIYGNEWTINLHVLYEHGIALIGPDPRVLINPVSIDAVREASKRDLHEEWEPKLKDASWLQNSHYQAYVILTMCRILYRAKHDNVASKKVASTWAKNELGEPWSDLIQKAEQWHHGQEMNSADETAAFIRFVIHKFQ